MNKNNNNNDINNTNTNKPIRIFHSWPKKNCFKKLITPLFFGPIR